MPKVKRLTDRERASLLSTLRSRFEAHSHRHVGLDWEPIQTKLEADPAKLWSLHQVESTGGEPDVVGAPDATGAHTYIDCSAQSPTGRRSVCYDGKALESRKEHKPKASAVEFAAKMGARLLSVEEYQALQRTGPFDTTTSSWVRTPDSIRALGGALFCDRRYNTVFVYHNGAESYYAARGFRCALTV
jgi:hypothetical protein